MAIYDDFTINYNTKNIEYTVTTDNKGSYDLGDLYGFIKDITRRDIQARERENNINDLLGIDEKSEEEIIPFEFPSSVIINLKS